MTKRKKAPSQPSTSPQGQLSESDSELQPPPKTAKHSTMDLDSLILDPSPVSSFTQSDCFNLIIECCNLPDKRSASKFLDLIQSAATHWNSISNKPDQTQHDETVISLLNDIRSKVSSNSSQPKSFSQIVSSGPPLTSRIPDPKKQELTLFIAANPNQSSDTISKHVNSAITEVRKTKPNLKINKVIRYSKGNILKVPNTDDLDTLIEFFKKYDAISNAAKVFVPTPRDPTIVLKKVNKFTEAKELPKILAQVNDELSGLEDEIRFLFEMRSMSQFRDVVLRVSPKVFQLISANDTVFTEYEAVKFEFKVFVKQCKHCFQFNSHRSMDCPSKTNATCADCGERGSHNCSKINKCTNCSSYFRTTSPDQLNHRPNSHECPLYKRQAEKLIQQTAFKPQSSSVMQYYASQPLVNNSQPTPMVL